MTTFPFTSANIKVRVQPKWPASITGTGGVDVTTASAVATVSLDYESLTPLGSITDPSDTVFGVLEDGTYKQVSAATLLGAIQAETGTALGDANYTMLSTDRYLYLALPLTAARTITLPAASTIAEGADVVIADAVGGISGSFTLTIQRAGSDTIEGGTSIVLPYARSGITLRPDPAGRWTVVRPQLTVQQAASVGVIARPGGRLTLSTGVPVLTSDVTAATTVYYTLYEHDRIPIYDGTWWEMRQFAELSQTLADTTKSPAAATTNSNYDLFVWNDGGTMRCTRGPAWTSDTARGTGAGTTELERLNGIWVNKIAITNGPAARRGTYVGTIRTNGSTQVEMRFGTAAAGGGFAWFGVWNSYNRVKVFSEVRDSSSPWTYASSTWRSANNSTSNRVSFVSGLAVDQIAARYSCRIGTGTTVGHNGAIGLGFDSTTSQGSQSIALTPAAATLSITLISEKRYLPQLGFHFIQAMESSGTGTTTYTSFSLEQALVMDWMA